MAHKDRSGSEHSLGEVPDGRDLLLFSPPPSCYPLESTLANDATDKRAGDDARRESREREAALEGSIAQLQASQSRAAHEAGVREDALRDELAQVRSRWQDAVARAETIAEEV